MLNITLDLDTGLAKLAAATTIKTGAQVPVTITTYRGATPTSPGASPAFELGLGTDATPPVLKAYLDEFAAENTHTFTGVLDANDLRLVTFMAGKGTVNFGCEVAWTVAGQLEVAPSFNVPVQSRIIPSDPTSEGGPDYYTEAEVDVLIALVARVALVAATGNLTLSGTQTIDGVAVIAGDVVFAKSQTTAADRKRYTVAAGAWTALDQPTAVLVQKGTVNTGRVFVLSAANTYSERLSAVDNTSDAAKPVSTLQQAALDLKAADDAVVKTTGNQTVAGVKTFSSSPVAPTPTAGDDSTKAATTAFVQAAINALIAAAPGALNTLDELAAALGDDANYAASMATALGLRAVKSANLSDLANADTALANLGGTAAGIALFKAATILAQRAQLNVWEIKAANFTAVAGGRYQIDTSGGVVTATLPAAPAVGDEALVEDAALSWATNNLTLARNGLKINGGTDDYTADVIGGKLSCIYISAGYGWSIK